MFRTLRSITQSSVSTLTHYRDAFATIWRRQREAAALQRTLRWRRPLLRANPVHRNAWYLLASSPSPPPSSSLLDDHNTSSMTVQHYARIFGRDGMSYREFRLIEAARVERERLWVPILLIVVPFGAYLMLPLLRWAPALFPDVLLMPKQLQEKNGAQNERRRRGLKKFYDVACIYGENDWLPVAKQLRSLLRSAKDVEGICRDSQQLVALVKYLDQRIGIDRLDAEYLAITCTLLDISSSGRYLYPFVLRRRLKLATERLKIEDTLLHFDGIETIDDEEVQQACIRRGIPLLNNSVDQRRALKFWLDVSHRLNQRGNVLTGPYAAWGFRLVTNAVWQCVYQPAD